MLCPDETSMDEAEYKQMATITEANKEKLKLYLFPNTKISFEQLFDGIDGF